MRIWRAAYLEVLPETIKLPSMAVKDGKFTVAVPIPSRKTLPAHEDKLGNDMDVSEEALEMNTVSVELRLGSLMEVSC
jgi:hypothetical protein